MSRMRIPLWMDFASASCVGVCEAPTEDREHPNKMWFSGTLLVLDEPSDQSPHGADGHRILVPSSVAKKRLGSLIGTALNYAPGLGGHSPRRKVGVITGAWISGDKLKVKGIVWKRDFPEAERDLKLSGLGMSMELGDVLVRDKDAPVWHLEDFYFVGATALKKSAAAYHQTSLAASAARRGESSEGVVQMDKNKDKEKKNIAAAGDKPTGDGGANNNVKILVQALQEGLVPAISAAVTEGIKPLVESIQAQYEKSESIAVAIEDLKLMAAATEEEKEADSKKEEDWIDAAGDEKEEDEDEEDEDEDEEDEEDMEAELEKLAKKPAEQEPGELNKDAKNQGSKTSVSAAVAASSVLVRKLFAANRKLATSRKKDRKELKQLRNKVEAMEAQVELSAERTQRQSLSAEAYAVLNKAQVDVDELFASGKKLSVAEMDEIFAQVGVSVDPTTRASIKNQLAQRGLLDEGRVVRSYAQ